GRRRAMFWAGGRRFFRVIGGLPARLVLGMQRPRVGGDAVPQLAFLRTQVAWASHARPRDPAGRGISGVTVALWRRRPASAPAASPVPTNRSARPAPTMALPVSWQMTRPAATGAGSDGASQSGVPGGNTAGSTARLRIACRGWPALPIGPLSGGRSTGLKKAKAGL